MTNAASNNEVADLHAHSGRANRQGRRPGGMSVHHSGAERNAKYNRGCRDQDQNFEVLRQQGTDQQANHGE